MLDVLPLRINRDHVIVSGYAWIEYHRNLPQATFQDFWLYCCQTLDRGSYILSRYFDQRDRYLVAVVDNTSWSSPRRLVGPREVPERDTEFSYASHVVDSRRPDRNYVMELFLDYPWG